MAKRKGLSTGAGVAIVAVLGLAVLVGTGTINLSAANSGDDTAEVKDATLNLKASQLGSSSGISTTGYAVLEDGTVVTKSLSADQFTAWTNTFTNQMDNIELMAFDSSNYPISETFGFNGDTVANKNIKTAAIASASDVSIELRETSGSSDNDGTVDIAAGGQATLDSVRANVDIQDLYWNTGIVMFDTPDNSNVSIDMPNAEEVAVPDSATSGVDSAYEAYDPSMGDDSFEEFAVHDSSRVQVSGDDSNDPSESVTVYVDDYQAYEDSESGEIEFGVEDDSGSGLGLSAQSTTLTVN